MNYTTEKGKFIYEAFLTNNPQLHRRAYELLKGDLGSGIYELICRKIRQDMYSNGFKESREDFWANDVLNRTIEILWQQINIGKFRYKGEKPFWRFVHSLWYYCWLNILREYYNYNKKNLKIGYLDQYQLTLLADSESYIEDTNLDFEKIFRVCFQQLSHRSKAVLNAFWENPEGSEIDAINYLERHYPEMQIPKSGLRMIKYRSEKKLKTLVWDQLNAA